MKERTLITDPTIFVEKDSVPINQRTMNFSIMFDNLDVPVNYKVSLDGIVISDFVCLSEHLAV